MKKLFYEINEDGTINYDNPVEIYEEEDKPNVIEKEAEPQEEKPTWKRYRFYIYKSLNPFPETFTLTFANITTEKLSDKMGDALNGNAVNFVTEKGKIKIYDRNLVTKIVIKEIKLKK